MPTWEHALMIYTVNRKTYQRLKVANKFAMCEVEGGKTFLTHIIDVCEGVLLIENQTCEFN